jgi:tetratricopeptide (TPR) repeat protein
MIPTYLPAAPDKNPMFLEKRVYQGSSGKVYPLPIIDRIAEKPVDRRWKAVWIENEFLRALVLPEIGGRIHALQDKTNGYDLIYRQGVIKPALVGLAGPWISGGIEFNWPQHHRPATFLPVDFEIEEDSDGSKTIWCSDHEPMGRMKGMHGVCLHPGRAYLELKVRVYNRTPLTQTFLWWANVATRVHEAYQSFFPPDVYYVADHARRSMSEYPLAQGFYYGVNYGERGRKGIPKGEQPSQFVPPHCAAIVETDRKLRGCLALTLTPPLSVAVPPHCGNPKSAIRNSSVPCYAANDLSFYANIPTPCSYMAMGSQQDFFGGYDYTAQAGLVHIANHHISPGKKQWTWGNHEFGYAWDRNLTDPDAKGEFGPYVELMAGVYTDNQPDFSFLQPGETKTWSQFWYPIQQIGPVQHANLDAAVSLTLEEKEFRLGIAVTRSVGKVVVRLERADGSGAAEWDVHLVPGEPFVLASPQARKPWKVDETVLRVLDAKGHEIIAYRPKPRVQGEVPPPAAEPPAPEDIASADELYLTGLHLEQYRHATRSPVDYWREALRRDLGDARCNNALGLWHLRRGEFAKAEQHLRKSIERLTLRNANPYDGEAFYNLGLCLRFQMDCARAHEASTGTPGRHESAFESDATSLYDAAYAAFYKATWNQAWAGASFHALAEMDCLKQNWGPALDHLNRALRLNADNLRARNLKVLVLRELGDVGQTASLLQATQRLDRLDWWARHLAGEEVQCDLQTCLDVAHDYARAGYYGQAIGLLRARSLVCEAAAGGGLNSTPAIQSRGALPLVHYTLGWLEQKRGDSQAALEHFKRAVELSPDYCFPARLEEIAILEAAQSANPKDARAPYYLANLLYDRRRHEEAIRLWERSAALDAQFSIVWRNLGIGYFNIRQQPAKARAAYERAFRANPADARLLYERDQLWKRLGVEPARRLRALEKHSGLVQERDDLSVELCALHNQTGQPEKALKIVRARKFQPWEGGEGGPLGQHVRSYLALGRQALARGDAAKAREYFEAALATPENLGEAVHLLANQSDIHYWLGCALDDLGEAPAARHHWLAGANFKGDFQEMKVRVCSEMTYYSALAWKKLGQPGKARKLLRELLAYGRQLQQSEAKIDYFATSLPTVLLFEDDLRFRQETSALFLQAQALLGLGRTAPAKRLLRTVLTRDPSHAPASDLTGDIPLPKSSQSCRRMI